MLLPILIVIKQHSLISPETKVCLLGSPCTCDNVFSIRQSYRDSPEPKTINQLVEKFGPNLPFPNLPLLFKLHEIWSVDSQKKIIEIVATKCYILRLKCTKFNFR